MNRMDRGQRIVRPPLVAADIPRIAAVSADNLDVNFGNSQFYLNLGDNVVIGGQFERATTERMRMGVPVGAIRWVRMTAEVTVHHDYTAAQFSTAARTSIIHFNPAASSSAGSLTNYYRTLYFETWSPAYYLFTMHSGRIMGFKAASVATYVDFAVQLTISGTGTYDVERLEFSLEILGDTKIGAFVDEFAIAINPMS